MASNIFDHWDKNGCCRNVICLALARQKYLFLKWTQAPVSSVRLLSVRSRLASAISIRSKLHNEHIVCGLLGGVRTWWSTFHVIWGSSPLSFALHTNFDNSVLRCCSRWAKEYLWPPYRCLKVQPVEPMYSFSPSDVFTVAWYMMFFTRHFPASGHASFCRQLQVFCGLLAIAGSRKSRALCDWMLHFTFGMQLYESLIVFRLKIRWYGWSLVKCRSTILKNSLPTFVLTEISKGALK